MAAMYNDYEDVSFFQEEQEPIMAPIRSDKIVRANNPIFFQNEGKQFSTFADSKSLNVLNYNKISSKMDINEEFLDLVASDNQNQDVAIVSFIGPRKIGKSFLIDCIISHQERAVSREMTKKATPLVNMPTKNLVGRNKEKIYLFDCDGVVDNERFMWMYFLSSTIVLNLNPLDRSGEEQFLGNLSYLQSHLDSDPENLTLPKLIILRRDAENKDLTEKQFLKRIDDYGLFNKDIICLSMSYPGSVTVKAKNIVDVPESALNRNYLQDVTKVYDLIRSSAKPKYIQGNILGTKILSLTIDPLTKSINKNRKINTGKMQEFCSQFFLVGTMSQKPYLLDTITIIF